METLLRYLPRRTFAIVAGYRGEETAVLVAAALIGEDDGLSLSFPKGHPFEAGDRVTVHLDDRTGVEIYSAELLVHRCSYKGLVVSAGAEELRVKAEEYTLIHGSRVLIAFKSPGYDHPRDPRPMIQEKAPRPGKARGRSDPREDANKLGVWITRGVERPHTTVMAFLSSEADDIFLISQAGSFKSSLIHRDRRCHFAIDHRANWNFEKRYEWNYTIVRAEARIIPRGDPRFAGIQAEFVEKNPWEIVFFTDPSIELFHLEPLAIECPERSSSLGTRAG